MAAPARKPSSGLTVVAMGYLVRCPIGGMAWHHLQYMMGLARLGHDVYFLEDSGDDPWACYDPARGVTDADPTYGLGFATRVFRRVGLDERWAYHDALHGVWHGPAAGKMLEILDRADVLLNLSGANPLRPWVRTIPVRVFVDTDPVFTQLRHLANPERLRSALEHTCFFSFGENFATELHSIPNDGLPWRRTRQPVVLDAWPFSPAPQSGRFTTVMQWEDTLQAVPRKHDGKSYGLKSDSFPAYLSLPTQTSSRLEIALGGSTAPRAELIDRGWALRDPLEVTRDPWTYQAYLRESKAELSVAKHGYVVTQSGWFSERSACYLASGRPVVVQDTGFSRWLPADRGVFAFDDADSAVAALQSVDANLQLHSRSAREIAEQYFDSGPILSSLIEEALR